jgi:hypothetical protein
MNTMQTDLPHWDFSDDLYSAGNARGTYHPLQFVVRLRQDFYAQLNSGPSGTVSLGEADFDTLSAFSTYFHETVHWWQHIGSTTGLMLSFANPAQCHVNLPHLLKILDSFGPKKSLKKFLSDNYDQLPEEPRKELNIVLNNWHDVEFNRRIILDPLRLQQVLDSPFFECIGHSLEVGLAHTLWLLSATIDPELRFLPDFRRWETRFDELRSRKVDGFFYGSTLRLVPLGAIRIFEGQARFCQVQFLHLASGGKLGWDELKKLLSFGDPYVTAFERFLEWAQLDWPDSPVHPTVHLFLLTCELAINPCDGFPFDIQHFESFVESNDPSFRFMWFALHIAKNPELKTAIRTCSKVEYERVSTALCRSLGCRQPVEISRRIWDWVSKEESLRSLLREDETFDFKDGNLPIRVCFAKYIRFAEDRLRRPDFFAWPAMHFVGGAKPNVDLNESLMLFARHQPLFIADMDGDIRPSLVTGREESEVYRTFNDFYYLNVLYHMVRQWIVEDGPFDYDFTWLTPKYTPQFTKPWVDALFTKFFNTPPDSFEQT